MSTETEKIDPIVATSAPPAPPAPPAAPPVAEVKPAAPPAVAPKKLDDKADVNNLGPGNYVIRDPLKGGAIKLRITFGNQLTYADGSSKFGGGVKFDVPDKNGRQIIIEGQEARITIPPGKQVGTVDVTGGTKLTTSDGIVGRQPFITLSSAYSQ